jgi:hypothetical protein
MRLIIILLLRSCSYKRNYTENYPNMIASGFGNILVEVFDKQTSERAIESIFCDSNKNTHFLLFHLCAYKRVNL